MPQDSIHSKFLIHWTGKNKTNFTEYIDRLKDVLEKGLYMNPGTETINGRDGKWIKAEIARVCFTEIKLSQTQKHAELYGKLGIGFHRSFVLEREGNPVFYLQNNDKGHIIENLDYIVGWMDSLPQETLGTKKKELEIVLGYIKNMSRHNTAELEYYDEMEWRMVHISRLTGEGNYFQDLGETDGDGKKVYRVKIRPEDIQLLVFPDNETRCQAINDEYIINYFGPNVPTFVVLSDCNNF